MSKNNRFSPEQIAEIRKMALRSDRSGWSIAKELGLSEAPVAYHVKKARESQKTLSQAAIHPPQTPAPIEHFTRQPKPQSEAIAKQPCRLADVSFSVSDETLDAWWLTLPTKAKADLLAARLGFLLAGGEGIESITE